MELFWNTIARYNAATWGIQLLLVAATVLLTLRLYRRPSPRVKLAMKLCLAALDLWIAGVYYGIYCRERDYADILALFWGIMALVWLYDAFARYTTFERTRHYDRFAYALLALPFVYPLVSVARGLEFPMITSPVMPCGVAVFTIGLLLSFSRRVNIFIILFLCHWALIGFSKVYLFRIPEDLLLAGCTIPALYLFFREYIVAMSHTRTKPDVRVMNALLILVCAAIGAFFTFTVWQQFRAMC